MQFFDKLFAPHAENHLHHRVSLRGGFNLGLYALVPCEKARTAHAHGIAPRLRVYRVIAQLWQQANRFVFVGVFEPAEWNTAWSRVAGAQENG